jgi:pimeloyl-ACP methyl ester carboxylesterase
MLTMAVPDGRVAVTEAGHGPAVVLVHGGTSTGRHEWQLLSLALQEHARVITLDLRGHGLSVNHGGALTESRFALDLPHVLRRLGIGQAVFIGFSLGANTVLRLLTRHPERARAAILIGGSATGDPDRIRSYKMGPWPRDLVALHHPAHPDPGYADMLRRTLLENWARDTERTSDELARATMPVLVVHGEHDTVQTRQAACDLATRLPQGQLVVMPGAGHAVHRDRRDDVLRAVRSFLTATPDGEESAEVPGDTRR